MPLARKILLADDSVTAQNMGRKILTDAGYEVITVNNGSAALKKIIEHKPDLIVLAGFMKLVGRPFLEVFGGRCLNTHPALLPSFPGTHGVRDALAHGVKVTGCTVFIVDEGVDAGPIVAQASVPVADDDDEAALHERIKVAERALLVGTVGRMVREGWSVHGRKVRIGS